MALALEAGGGDYLSGRGAKRLFDEVCESILDEMRRLPAGEGPGFLAQIRSVLDQEITAEQRFHQEFSAALQSVQRAGTPEELSRLRRGLDGLVTSYFIRRESVPALHSLCTTILDSIIRQALHLAEESLTVERKTPPPTYAWLVLGPAGRRETTLTTELECLLVHEDGAEANTYGAELAAKAVAMLVRCGIRTSRSGIMPDNRAWCASVDTWRDRLEELCRRNYETRTGTLPNLAGIRLDEFLPLRKTNLSTPLFELADLRIVAGDKGLGQSFISLVRDAAERHPSCIQEAAYSVAALPSPFTFLGNYKVERRGPHRGKLDLNRWGRLPLVAMVRHQAVTGGLAETGTLERIQALLRSGTLDVEMGRRLLQAGMEIFRQKSLLEIRENAGQQDGAWLLPDSLSPADEAALRTALETVSNFQKVIYSSLAEKV